VYTLSINLLWRLLHRTACFEVVQEWLELRLIRQDRADQFLTNDKPAWVRVVWILEKITSWYSFLNRIITLLKFFNNNSLHALSWFDRQDRVSFLHRDLQWIIVTQPFPHCVHSIMELTVWAHPLPHHLHHDPHHNLPVLMLPIITFIPDPMHYLH
jgi:hypothetical protein